MRHVQAPSLWLTLFAFASTFAACGTITSDDPAAGVDAAPADAAPIPIDASGPVNLIRNGDFESEGTLHWTAVETSMSVVEGALELRQIEPTGPGLAWQMIPKVSATRVRFSADFVAGSFPTSIQIRFGNTINDNSLGVITADASDIEVDLGTKKAQVWVTVNNVATSPGQYGLFDNIALVEIDDE